MTTHPLYLTSALPYVNAAPHLGHALELVQLDTLARHARQHGRSVRTLTGTDEHSLKNVRAAAGRGIPTAELVRDNAERFRRLAAPLGVGLDDFLRTHADPRHAAGVRRLWRAWQDAGDLYQRHYQGYYCVDCEQFYDPAELGSSLCPVHHTPLEATEETNWFFRLSRYRDLLFDAVNGDRIRVQPLGRRNEVLGLLYQGIEDVSVSRSVSRAHGWGVPVPGDPTQVVYVWVDALAGYVTALDAADPDAPLLRRWWGAGEHDGAFDGERVHLIGKGILRFHALVWPALLASAGLPLPTRILVHDYLTVDGRKIAKSDPATVRDPQALAEGYGVDALRWWLLREVPRTGDTDFTTGRLTGAYQRDLAGGVGNLVARVTGLLLRSRGGVLPRPPDPERTDPAAEPLQRARERTGVAIRRALEDYDLRGGTVAILRLVDAANRYLETTAPWRLARAEAVAEADAEQAGEGDLEATRQLDSVLGILAATCADLAWHLRPFLPEAAARIAAALAAGPSAPDADRDAAPGAVLDASGVSGDAGASGDAGRSSDASGDPDGWRVTLRPGARIPPPKPVFPPLGEPTPAVQPAQPVDAVDDRLPES